MNKAPAFQFYAADYLADENVQLLSLEEEGAYIRALAYCWREGSIPADADQLSRLLKGATNQTVTTVQRLFKVGSNDGSRLVHPRLELEREKQRQWAEKSRRAGIESGKSRRNKKLQDEPNTNQRSILVEPNTNSSSSSSSSNIVVVPKEGTTTRKRRSRTEILSPYPPEVSTLVNEILPEWPKAQPKDKSPIHFDVPMMAERIDGLLKQPQVTGEILKQAARRYLSEPKNYYRAPQFFFGPSAGEKSPPWVAYARMTIHQGASRGI